MSTEIPQEKLVSIARDFAKAAMNKQDDVAFEDRMLGFTSDDEAVEFMQLGEQLVDLKERFGDTVSSTPEYAETAIATANKLADIYARFCTEEEIAEIVPKSARETGIAEAFEARGATALAKMIGPARH